MTSPADGVYLLDIVNDEFEHRAYALLVGSRYWTIAPLRWSLYREAEIQDGDTVLQDPFPEWLKEVTRDAEFVPFARLVHGR